MYQIVLSLHDNRVLMINGPYPAGQHDIITVFRKTLKKELKKMKGKKGIADNGYRGEECRACSRQECFNTRMACFGILEQRFRHPFDRHQIVAEAMAVIGQHQLENGSPLFDV